MKMDEHRLNEIDGMVAASNHAYNPVTGRFEAMTGAEAENNMDHEPESFVSFLNGVSVEEIHDYCVWRRALLDRERQEREDQETLNKQQTENS